LARPEVPKGIIESPKNHALVKHRSTLVGKRHPGKKDETTTAVERSGPEKTEQKEKQEYAVNELQNLVEEKKKKKDVNDTKTTDERKNRKPKAGVRRPPKTSKRSVFGEPKLEKTPQGPKTHEVGGT